MIVYSIVVEVRSGVHNDNQEVEYLDINIKAIDNGLIKLFLR